MPKVYLVKTNGDVLAAYNNENIAQVHARTITGARVEGVELLDRLPDSVTEDALSDDWDDNGVTPVDSIEETKVK